MNASRMTLCTFASGLLLSAAVAATPASSEAPPRPAAPTQPAAPAKPASSAPIVTLMDAGAEPHRELRLSPQVGTKQRIVISVQQSSEQAVGAFAAPPTVMPEMVFTLDTEVESIENGIITCRMEYTGAEVKDTPGVNPRVLDAMRRSMEDFVGLTGRSRMNDRGEISTVEFERKPGMNPVLAQQISGVGDSMRQMIAPLPAEPIGVGGTWQTFATVEVDGFQMNATTIIKLTKLTDDGFETEISVTMDAEEQDKVAPNMPAGSKVRLMNFDSKGRGTAEQRFSNILPHATTMTTETRMNLDLDTPAMSQSMTQTMRGTMSMREAERPVEQPAE